MRVTTVRDIGALVRTARRAQGMTQADLARRLGVGREWIVRLEGGHPRLETQKVLDTLVVLGLGFDVEQVSVTAEAAPAEHSAPAASEEAADPFESLFAKRGTDE